MTDYSRGDYADLPAGKTDLENNYTAPDLTAIASNDNSTYAEQTANNEIAIHQYKKTVTGQYTNITWSGKSSLAPSESPVIMEVYNVTGTPAWEELDRDDSTAADTDFDIIYNNLATADYLDSGVITWRVYQAASAEAPIWSEDFSGERPWSFTITDPANVVVKSDSVYPTGFSASADVSGYSTSNTVSFSKASIGNVMNATVICYLYVVDVNASLNFSTKDSTAKSVATINFQNSSGTFQARYYGWDNADGAHGTAWQNWPGLNQWVKVRAVITNASGTDGKVDWFIDNDTETPTYTCSGYANDAIGVDAFLVVELSGGSGSGDQFYLAGCSIA